MQPANPTSVKGGFDNVRFRYDDVVSTFFQRDGRYWVRTDGPDGKLADFEIKYTFGVDPLQQDLIELPRGRVQALSIAWDTRPKSAGGQRWFHLYPGEHIRHGDELHWTQRQQNWNFMCADCHSTNLRKQYRRGERQLPDHVERDQRLLRGLSRAWVAARELGAAGTGIFLDRSDRQRLDRAPDRAAPCRVDDCPRHAEAGAQRAEDHVVGDRRVRAVSFTAIADLRRVLRGGAAARFLRTRDDRAFAVLPRRAAAGGGLYSRLVPAESNGARGRHLQRLSRAPFSDAPGPGQHALRTVPCPRAL